MNESAALRALRRGVHLAAEIPGYDANRPAFVGVYPLDLALERSQEFVRNQGVEICPRSVIAYRVRRFSIDRTLIDSEHGPCESDLHDKAGVIAFTENELVSALGDFGISLSALELPAHTDYPI